MSNDLVSNFEDLISFFEKESKTLKCLASLHGITADNIPSTLKVELASMEAILNGIESKVSEMEDYIENEANTCVELRRLADSVNEQTVLTNELMNSTPSCFELQKENKLNNVVHNATGYPLIITSISSIEPDEFAKIPFATKGRCTITQLNIAWAAICKLLEDKYKVSVSKLFYDNICIILVFYLIRNHLLLQIKQTPHLFGLIY